MKHITKLKLAAVAQLCEREDRSTEFMLQLMQDACGVDMNCCLAYMDLRIGHRLELYDEVNSLTDVMIKLEEMK